MQNLFKQGQPDKLAPEGQAPCFHVGLLWGVVSAPTLGVTLILPKVLLREIHSIQQQVQSQGLSRKVRRFCKGPLLDMCEQLGGGSHSASIGFL